MQIDGEPYAEAMDCVLIAKARKQDDLVCNPIFEWTFSDVWDFIHDRNIPYNPIYDPPYNYERCGCVGCPLGGRNNQLKEFHDFPAYKQLYINAFQRMVDKRKEDGLKTVWNTGQEVYDWWTRTDSNQLSLEDVFNEDGTLKEQK